jgi:hypothetical protein
MGMDIQIKPEEVFANEDRSWLGTRDGMLNCRSITLNSDHFDDEHLEEKGAVKSGTPIVLYSDGMYGPYRGDAVTDASETQVISRTATGGTFTFTITDPDDPEISYVSDAVAASAAGLTAAAVNAALASMAQVQDGEDTIENVSIAANVLASGSAGGPITLTFRADWAEQDIALSTIDDALATGGDVTIAAGVAGNDGSLDAAGNNGHLFSTTVIDKANHTLIGAAMYWTGVVKYHKLPSYDTADFNVDDAWLAGVTAIRYEDAMNNRIVAVPA